MVLIHMPRVRHGVTLFDCLQTRDLDFRPSYIVPLLISSSINLLDLNECHTNQIPRLKFGSQSNKVKKHSFKRFIVITWALQE